MVSRIVLAPNWLKPSRCLLQKSGEGGDFRVAKGSQTQQDGSKNNCQGDGFYLVNSHHISVFATGCPGWPYTQPAPASVLVETQTPGGVLAKPRENINRVCLSWALPYTAWPLRQQYCVALDESLSGYPSSAVIEFLVSNDSSWHLTVNLEK